MQQQQINLEWGNGQFKTLRFSKDNTIFNVKSRIMDVTSIPLDKQELIGLNSNSDSLPLYCLDLNNPQTVLLIQPNEQEEEQEQEQEKIQGIEIEKEDEEEIIEIESEEESEEDHKREIIKLKKSDSEIAKELQEHFWRENMKTPPIKRYHQTHEQPYGRKWFKNTNNRWVEKRNEIKQQPTQERITYDSLMPLIPPSMTFNSEKNKQFNSIANEKQLPAIEENGISALCSKAKRECRPILLYFHSFKQEPKLHEDFVQETLSNPEVAKIINQNYLLFVSDVDQKEKQFEELKTKLNIKSSPALLILSNSTLKAVLDIIQGDIKIDDLIFKLFEKSELFMELNYKNNSKPKLQKSLSVIERENQDLEFEKFLQIDKEKQERLELEKILFSEKEKEIERLKTEKENMLKKLSSQLPSEPKLNEFNKNSLCRIKCRTKNQNIMRNFDINCQLNQVFSWVLVSENDIFNFELIQSFPKKRVFCSSNITITNKSLKSLNITKQVLFDIRIIDVGDENEDELLIN
ncbi:fas-associated factor 2 [Anaeramoeba flamelloides]|uniref:Fas-associated factor 2 n=1 Tax=Anaeramoeba flamelloides TaxID=1746091 RepID=A0ABQ8ZDD2_9EUKA|nr:fas-associated factor 2 [Anaeramoeba flamelloides]